jgi:hypothetical protein
MHRPCGPSCSREAPRYQRAPWRRNQHRLPQGLKALKQVAKQVGADLRGASLNLDGGCDAARHRNGMFHAGLIPNITESPRKRKTTKRGRKRRFDAAVHALRMRVEQALAWEDTCQRLLLRFERLQQRHSGMKLLASTMINLRAFCGASNSPPVHCLVTRLRRSVRRPGGQGSRPEVRVGRQPCTPPARPSRLRGLPSSRRWCRA